jgi:hypothetical protein
MPGPVGSIWPDTYITADPPPALAPLEVWLNPADPTHGPAQPECLGGSGEQAYPDTYFLTQNSVGTVPTDGPLPLPIVIETI